MLAGELVSRGLREPATVGAQPAEGEHDASRGALRADGGGRSPRGDTGRGRRLDGAERRQLLGNPALEDLDLALLEVRDELALLVADDQVEGDHLRARLELRGRLLRGRGGWRLGADERGRHESTAQDRQATPASSCRLPRVPGDTRALPFLLGPTSKDTAPPPGRRWAVRLIPRRRPRDRLGTGLSPDGGTHALARPLRLRAVAAVRARDGRSRRRRPRPDPAHGVEQLEQVRLQRVRDAHQGGRRRARGERDEGRGLPVRGDRRLLAGEPGRHGPDRGRPRALPLRDQGGRRLRPLEGPQVRHLLGRGHDDLRQAAGLEGPRGAGRPDVRRVGRRLPQVRLVPHGRAGHPRLLREDEPRAPRERPAHRLQHLRVGRDEALALGPGHRSPLARDRRHPGLLGLRQELGRHGRHPHHRHHGRPPPLLRARPLERRRHARGGQRRPQPRREPRPLQLLGALRLAAHGRQRPPGHDPGGPRRPHQPRGDRGRTRTPSGSRAARCATTGPARCG